jgi:hypothetical protein
MTRSGGRRPDASVGPLSGLSSGATRQGCRWDGADDDIDIDIDINIDIDIDIDIDFRPTDRGDGGILLPRRGHRRTRR